MRLRLDSGDREKLRPPLGLPTVMSLMAAGMRRYKVLWPVIASTIVNVMDNHVGKRNVFVTIEALVWPHTVMREEHLTVAPGDFV